MLPNVTALITERVDDKIAVDMTLRVLESTTVLATDITPETVRDPLTFSELIAKVPDTAMLPATVMFAEKVAVLVTTSVALTVRVLAMLIVELSVTLPVTAKAAENQPDPATTRLAESVAVLVRLMVLESVSPLVTVNVEEKVPAPETASVLDRRKAVEMVVKPDTMETALTAVPRFEMERL